MVMSTASRKAKGRRLQDWVASQLQALALVLNIQVEASDIRPALMGETGTDVKLSAKLLNVFPYAIECKNQEIWTGVYKAYDQAVSNSDSVEPLLIIKMNHKKPLALVDAEYFIKELKHDQRRK